MLALFALAACSPGKFMPEGDVLYRGSEVVLEGPAIPQKEKFLTESVASKLQPKPNRKFLGMFYTKLWLYEKVRSKPDKEKGFKHWLKYKIGEKPVLVTAVDTALNAQIVGKLLQDNGLFHTRVSPSVHVKRKQALVRYTAVHDGVSRIASYRLPQGTSEVEGLAREWKGYSAGEGKVYSLLQLRNDRTGLATHIRSRGYYDFTEKSILYLVDTARADNQLGVNLRIRRPESDSVHRKYYLNQVRVYPTYEVGEDLDSVSYRRTFSYKGMEFRQHYKYIGRKALYRMLLVEPGDLFSMRDRDVSVNRLINTGIFRYVNIAYTPVARDSLDVDIYLTPTEYQGVKFDVEANTSNRSFLGSMLSVSYTNDNLFRGAERFSLKASGGTEFQMVNDKAALNLLNFSLAARLEAPGILSPFRTRKSTSEVMPMTYLSVEETFQKWLNYYSLNSLKLGAGYHWQSRRKLYHHLEPVSLEWIALLNKTAQFDELISGNPQLRQSFRTSMIFGPSYGFNVTSRRSAAQRSYVYYAGKAELAGNLAYLGGRLFKPGSEDRYKVFGVPFANFARIDNEVRHYWNITPKMSLVSRLGIGVGFAYGNSDVLPYVRQFFMGGPNTIRAFEFRSVGPGSYAPEDESNPIEQAGDLQLLMNLEYRFTLYRFLRGALFADAGNVWLRRADPERPGAEFDFGRFYRELALGTGIGIRLDFDFFALRVDLGIPVYKPGNDDGERWLPQFPEQNFKDWRKANWAWNIAIGYPF